MNSSLLERLRPLVAEFEQQASRALVAEPEAFSAWLLIRLVPTPPVPPVRPAALPTATEHRQISRLLILLHRYWRRFARLALLEAPRLTTLNDYDYLATLHGQGSLSQQELIAWHQHSPRAGRRTIQRLLADELVVERAGADDARHQLLALAPDGQQLLAWLLGPVAQASLRLLGDLTPLERRHLHHLLSKLEAYHRTSSSPPPPSAPQSPKVFQHGGSCPPDLLASAA